MGFVWTIVIGFVAGVIAKFLHPGDNEPRGFILTTLLGIAGAFVATYFGQAMGLYRADEGAGLIGAIIGAIIVLAIWVHSPDALALVQVDLDHPWFRTVRLLSRCEMAVATFICPETALEVQASVTDHPGYASRVYQPIECIACQGVHFIDPKTGDVLRTKDDQRGMG